MRNWRLLTAGACLLVAACSQQPAADKSSAERASYEPPEVSPTAAPGVAWRYYYDYQLPDESIAVVQEKHAAACEAMGVAKCRITGLTFNQNDEQAVSGTLEVKLAPELARQFGKDATRQVTSADGRLLSTRFTGEDVAPTTVAAGREEQELKTRIADLERQLASAKSGTERVQLSAQLEELRNRSAAARGTIAEASEKLASTPMTFNYYGRGGIAGFQQNPVREAARSFVSSLVTMVTVVLQAVAILLPWALLLALLVFIAKSRVGRAVRRFLTLRAREGSES
jgi:hypothetical protein